MKNKKDKFQIVYIPAGVPTFHMETAGSEFEASKELLKAAAAGEGLDGSSLMMPDGLLLGTDKIAAFMEGSEPDLVVFQNTTFANAAYISEVLDHTDAHVLLWTLREPAGDGGRLKLNSLTGAYSAANTLRSRGRSFSYVLGSPSEKQTKDRITAVISAAKCRAALNGAAVATIGETPQGFGFGHAEDADLRETFGLQQITIDIDDMIARAKACKPEDSAPWLAEAEAEFPHFAELPEENRLGYAALMKAYADFAAENGIRAMASRCWPDYFTKYGTAVCAVLSVMNDRGIPAACETDTYGAVSMLIGYELSGAPMFFGDPVAADVSENTMTYWHCGMAAPSLAVAEEGPCAGVHCNRGIGPTMEFGCRGSERATVFRLGRDSAGEYRFFISTGTALSKPRQFHGTSLVVELDSPVEEVIYESVAEGWEPHFVVIYGDHSRALEELACMYGIPVQRY